MRRFLTLVSLLSLAVPAGISISGCTRNPAAKYCAVTSGYGILNTAVYSITLQPQIAGISLAYGQTEQASSPTAYTCTGATASVSSKSYQYGTTNNQLVDISPSGNICAGTWNRNTGGGIADYTYCNYPNPLPSTNGLPFGTAYITASADSVTSNPVTVYVHAPVTSITLVGPSSCLSQGQVAQLDSEAYFDLNGKQTLLCAPNSASVPDCESSIGTMSFGLGTSSVASINSTTNQITAEQPGTTAITASIAGSGSSAGYFSTCPPQSISVSLANGTTSSSIAQGTQQNLTTTVLDTNGNSISGLALSYQSTDPIDVAAGANGAITTSFPGTASINAVCQPPTCNPAPINEIGLNGTGLPISSNSATVTVPGTASEYAWFSSPGLSQYFVPIEVLSGTVGSNVRLPYVPNSMMMDREGLSLYFGSPRELMVYSTLTSTLSKQDPNAPGVVLAVSPNNSQLLINDQARHLFYLYNTSSGSFTTFGGMGTAAAWTPDGLTLYVVDNAEMNSPTYPAGQTPAGCPSTPLITGHTDTLYAYNADTGWTVESLPSSPLPASALPTCNTQPNTAPVFSIAGQPTVVGPAPDQSPAVTVPGVGAYLRGYPTTAHTWCPSGTVGNNAMIQFYPVGDSEQVQSDVLGATIDGDHILGAEATAGGGITLSDIAVSLPTIKNNGVQTPIECPITTDATTGVQTLGALSISSTSTQTSITGVDAGAINEIVTGAVPQVTASQTVASGLAFITYSPSASATTNALLPYYIPAPGGAAGALNYVTLTDCSTCGTITAPLAGAFSPDNTVFLVSTSGDNEIHYISIPPTVNATTPPTDKQQISPNLPACLPVANGGVDAGCVNPNPSATIVPATAIAVKPRSVT
jgi:trimeric autotransporter adhesin